MTDQGTFTNSLICQGNTYNDNNNNCNDMNNKNKNNKNKNNNSIIDKLDGSLSSIS